MSLSDLSDSDSCSDTDSMGYSTNQSFDLQEEIQETFDSILKKVKCSKILKLESDMFANLDRETITYWLVDALDTMRRSRNLIRHATEEIDVLQKHAVKDKSQIIELQQEVITENREQIKEVQSSLQTEIKSYRDAVCSLSERTSDKEQITVKDVKEAVKIVTEDNARSTNLMIFGLEDKGDLRTNVRGLFKKLGEEPYIRHCERIGRPVSSPAPRSRPIKVTLNTGNAVELLLKRSYLLRGDKEHKSELSTLILTSEEERRSYRELVNSLKQKIKEEPHLYHSIRKDEIISSPKGKSSPQKQQQAVKEESSPPPPR